MPYGTVNAEQMTTQSGYTLGAGNASSFKNRIINGGMTIDQRNAGAAYTNSNQSIYGLDRWRSYGLSGAVLTIQQSTTAPAGFSNSQSVTVTTSTTANDGGGLSQIIEANNVFDLNWGTSSGVAVTASFWVRASVIGTYNLYLRYYGSTASYYYVATYTVNVANTWEQKTINIAAPPVGAGAFTAALNSSYIEFRPVISSSGNTTTVTANTWSTSTASKTAGCVDLASNSGATFFITGVQFEVGTVATSFDFRSISTELGLCYRYCFAWRTDSSGYTQYGRLPAAFVTGTTSCTTSLFLPQAMRTTAYSVTYNNKAYQEYYLTGAGATGSTIVLNTDANGTNWVTLNLAFTGTALPTTTGIVAGVRYTNATDAAIVVSTEL
jgi:hypothetical protein